MAAPTPAARWKTIIIRLFGRPTPAARWKTIIIRLFGRPTPYWRKRLEDEQEPAPVLRAGEQVIGQFIFAMILAIVVLLPTAYLAVIVFVSPGGLPQLIGSQLADVCRTTGKCDFGYLMAGYAFGLNFVIVAIAFLWITIGRVSEQVETNGTAQDLAYIDERIVSLRNELVLAGIITVPAEERKGDSL